MMSDFSSVPQQPSAEPHNIWKRGLLMLLMVLGFQVSSSLLCLLAVVQFVLALLGTGANQNLRTFACSLGSYLRQIAEFVGFATEEIPFPFADWPSGEPAAASIS
jgi:hypothetical protein